ncbi:MAG: linear pentadecapeptide gramicidin synthetase LgrD, partial [Segetibacter sp.]|nr:linear pentadecapeptide gramicidin synthetase LgrD [Segetibacter sp.]
MKKKPFPLHPAQKDVFIDQLLDLDSPHYNIGGYIKLVGNLDKATFSQAVNSTPEVFDAYKIRLGTDTSNPSFFLEDDYAVLEFEELNFSKEGNPHQFALQWMEENFNAPFNIQRDELLFTHYLIKVGENEHWFYGKYHHLITDGYGFTVFVQYLASKYKSLLSGEGIQFKFPSYVDEVAKAAAFYDSPGYEAEGEYWKERIRENPQKILQKKSINDNSREKKSSTFILNASNSQSSLFTELQLQTRVSLQQLTIAALIIYFGKTTSGTDFVFGIPLHKRGSKVLRNIVGMFSGIQPFKGKYDKNYVLINFLKEISLAQRKDYRFQDYLIGDLSKHFQTTTFGEGYLTDIVVNYEPLNFQTDFGEEVASTVLRLANEYEVTPLQLVWRDYGSNRPLQLHIHYRNEYFDHSEIELLAHRLTYILEQFPERLEAAIGGINILPPLEIDLLKAFNQTAKSYPQNKTIIDLFEEQVRKTPSEIAIVFDGHQLTFFQLNRKANQFAHYLRNKGVREEILVPICIERGLEMIIGLLGIMKAGGAYVPIDPEYPLERIVYMVEDTSATLIVSSGKSRKKLPVNNRFEIIEVDVNSLEISGQSTEDLQMAINPSQLAYVIYTSGSTGNPKGVMIEHCNVYSFICWCCEEFANNRFDVVYASTSICFDLSVYEIFYPLTIGKKVRIIENGLQAAKYLSEDTKVLINSVPVVIEHLLKEGTNLSNVSLINMAGEPIPLHVKQGLDTDRIEVRNLYGPSEDTTYSTVYKLKPDEPILIGKPIANTQVFITDSEGQLVPIGVAGEICLGGSGVARGYLNRPELTSQKFVKNRFSDATGSLVYETGDLGRWLANGQLEYLGRIDDQVKVRGFRIEPGEIESVLVQSQLVEQAVVVAKVDGKGSKRLVAYVVVKGELNSEAISSYLRSKLPEYMVPALWMALGSLPLTPNGKIDRKALPNPDSVDQTSKEYVAPRNEFETTLAEVWQELLLTGKVGIYDNFFELGGDSIITIQAISRINRAGYSIKPKDFFIHQTIARLSSSITNSTDKRSACVTEQGVLKGPANLLPIQEWYFENNSLFVSQYNQSILLDLSKEVNEKILELAIQQILQQHDSLGFQYYQKDGKWYQEYVEKNLSLAIEDLTSLSEDVLDEEIIEKTTVFQKSLNIEQGELVRVVLFKTPEAEKKNRLFITIHHLAVDGVSWRILLEDLELLINDLVYDRKANLGDKGTSYRQWYNELLRYGQGNKVLSQKNYWQQVIKNAQLLPVDLGAGHPVKAKDISKHTVRLDVDSTLRLIKEVPRVYHTEINDNLLCALSKTLFEFFDKDKVCIGLEGHGREEIDSHINISRTVGWFTNLYPVVLIANSTEGIDGWIKSVKEQLREVPDKGIGFGVLKYINREATLQGKDCWDVIFNYLGQLDNVFNEHGWLNITKGSVTLNRNEAQIVNEKLALDSYIQDQQFVLTIGYSNIHYKTETIHRFANLYIANLVSIIDHCAQLDNASNLVFTPSDFSLNPNVSFKELDKFLQEQVGEKTRGEHIDKIYRLTGLQEGLLFHGLYDGKNGGYIQQFSCEMENLDLDAFSKSWQLIIKQHSVLRTAFYHHALSVPVQCVFKEGKLPLSVLDISSHSSAEQRTAIEKYTSEDRIQGFDFKEAPLMRFCLIKLSKEKCRMVWTAHHLLFDGWSLPVLFEDFLNTYEDLVAGNKILFRKEDQFEEFVRYIERIDLDQAELYWKKYLEGISQNTLLPFIDNTADRNKGAGFYKSISLRIDNNITAGIKGFAQKHHLTVNTLMQGVWSLLLHKYTGNDYVVYGVVVSGRPENLEGIERRVGMYVNTLPFKSSIQNHYTTTEWLQTLQNGQVENLQHQNTPLQQIQEWIGMKGDLFDSLLVFENYPISNLILNKKWSLNITNIQMSEQTNYPLTIQITQSDNFHIQFTYNAELLQDVFVTEIQEHFLHVLTQIINSSVVHLSDISVLTSRQEQQLLFEFNNTNSNYPSDKSVVDLFELQVLKSPEDVALLFEEEKVTYAELNKRANQLAHYLRSNGVKAETLVPICIERSAELIVGILGILKAGGAYVPIDPSYPDERIQYMFEDTGASLVLTSKENRNKLALKHAVRIVQIDDWPVISEEPLGNLHVTIPPDNLAYVIYTSGSTGKPKGVMVEHGNIVSLIKGMHYVSLTNEDILLSTGSPSFDATTFEYWGMLLNGGQLVLCKENKLLDNELFKKEIVDRKVTKMWFTSSWFNHIVETDISVFEKLKTILVGGEKLSEKHIQRVRETFPSMEIVNGYGPTENTTFSITHKITDNKPTNIIPIGRPLSNRTAYVVDKAGDLVPVGVNGEIWLGGSGVSRGYLNQPELTAEKFIRSPFDENEGSILYKTGDVGRWLPEGVVQYIGRLDDQVKIRGFRIELGEVESILKQHDGIANVVVIAREDNPGHKQMVAYIVSQGTFDKEDVIVYAKNKLPDYMLPSFWVELKSLPLTANGKIDKKALPEPDVSELVTSHFVAPRNEVEFTLADVWQKLLGIERVGINNNFFDLGGNSLLAMRLTSAIRRQLETELAIKEIFLYPTIAELAEQILAKERVLLLPPVVPLKQRPERIPLSFSQERLWFVDKLEGSTQYHIAAVLHLKGDLNTANLEKAIKYVINRHEVLRTIFLELEGDPFQVIKTAEEWNLNIIGDIPFTKDESELKKLIENLINQPFDLSKDDMLRGHLIRQDDHLHLLVVTIHHIAADGWSVPIILNEINAVYTAFEEGEQPELAPLVIQYTDYAIWQRKHLKGELFERKLSFWKDRLQNIAPLQLPTDYSRPSIQTGRGGVYNFNVDKEIVSALHELGRQQGATLFMTLMSAFKVLLYRHTNQIDITVGTATANRTPAEVEGLVGFFINTLAIRDEVNGDATFTDFLQQVKSTTLKAYDNQEVPFEKVVETVVKERDMNVTPIFQVMFVLQNTAQVKSPRIGNLAVTIEEYDANTAKYDISFFVSETEDGLKASVEYSSDLFKRKT